MTRKRILQIVHSYYNRGGVEEHIKSLSSALSDSFDVYVLAPLSISPTTQQYQLLSKGIPLLQWNGPSISWPCSELHEPSAHNALLKTLTLIKPDIIHIQHLLNWPLNTIEILSSVKVPMVMSFHDYFCGSPQYTLEFAEKPREELTSEYALRVFGADISQYLNERRKYLIRHINKVQKRIVPSFFAKKAMSVIFPNDYHCIPHGTSSFKPINYRNTSTILRFAYVGSLLRQKGIQSLIEGFMKAAKSEDNIELHIYGGGPEESIIPEHPSIIRHQRYKPKDLDHILADIDIGIVPSIFRETYCYTLAELQLAGKPAICSDIGALSERIENFKNGLSYVAGSSEDLAEKIIWCNNNRDHSWNVESPRTVNEMAEDYKKLFWEILA